MTPSLGGDSELAGFSERSAGRGKCCGDTFAVLLLRPVSTITAKQLHQEIKAVLNQLEQGESLVITRNGRAIGRIEPLTVAKQPGWKDLMDEVWRPQKSVKAAERTPNPVLLERQRRRR